MLLIVDAVDVVVVVAVVSGERGVLLASFFETGPDCHSFPELFVRARRVCFAVVADGSLVSVLTVVRLKQFKFEFKEVQLNS